MEQPCLLTFISLAKNAASHKQTGWPFVITVSSLSLSSYSSQSEKKFWSALLEKNSQSGNISKTDWAGGWACCAQSHSSIHAWDNHIRAPLYPSHWSLSTTTVMSQQLHIFKRRLGDGYPLQYSPERSPLSLGQNLHISNAIWGEKVKGRSKVRVFF